MRRVKGIKSVFQRRAFPAVIQQDGDGRRPGKYLHGHEPKQRVQQPVEKVERNQAYDGRFTLFPQKIEYQYERDAKRAVIRAYQLREEHPDHHYRRLNERVRDVAASFHAIERQKADRQRKEYVLGVKVEEAAAVQQVEGYFGYQGERPEPDGVTFDAARMEKAFAQQKGEYRIREASGRAPPRLRGLQSGAYVIDEHRHDGNHL
jgi:hypothetical protein